VFIKVSTASSIEYGRGVSTGNPTFTRNPNFDKLKNPPKEKNMAEFGWGNIEDLGKSSSYYIDSLIFSKPFHINITFEKKIHFGIE
jgi:hypothetical protein